MSNSFPKNPDDWERLINEAPGEDRPPTPEEEAHWRNAVVAHSLSELRKKLVRRTPNV